MFGILLWNSLGSGSRKYGVWSEVQTMEDYCRRKAYRISAYKVRSVVVRLQSKLSIWKNCQYALADARVTKHPKHCIISHVIWEILSILQPIYRKQFPALSWKSGYCSSTNHTCWTHCTYSRVIMCVVHLSETMDALQPQYTAWGLWDAYDSTKYN